MKVGTKVSEMEFNAYHNGEIKKMKLSDFKGKWLVLLFYPADFTFICPTELEEAANLYAEFVKAGAEVLSVSTDTAYSHKAWHDTSQSIKKINFPMVADPTGSMSRYFNTYIEEEGLSLRGSFIVDPDGILKLAEIHDNSIGRNANEILRKLKAAVYVHGHNGEVCPASWQPGSKTLKPGVELIGKI